MVNAHVTHSIDALAADMQAIAVRAPRDMKLAVREGLKVGNRTARDNARGTSGRHAKLYPGSFSWEMTGPLEGEYGPVPGGQGSLAPILERGSRNNPAHLDLARSADVVGPAFAEEVHRLPDRWFW